MDSIRATKDCLLSVMQAKHRLYFWLPEIPGKSWYIFKLQLG